MRSAIFKRLVLLLFVFIVVPANAKAITFQLTKTADNLKPGGVSTVVIKTSGIKEDSPLNGYNLNLKFNNTKLEYAGGTQSSMSNVVNAGGGILNIKNKTNDVKTKDFEVARFNFKVLGNAMSGNAELALSGTCTSSDEEISCSYNSSQITVVALGTDASLSSLKIPNTTLKPSFNSNVTNYTATVQDQTELTVNATANDPTAKITISDNYKRLQKGENKIDVTVVSEDGQNKNTYSIVVTLNMTPTDEELLKANATLKNISVKGQKLDFTADEKKYYLTVPYETKKLNITATPTNSKAKVEIDGYKKLIVGKNTIKITVTSEDKTKVETYQIIVTREDEEKEIVQTCPDETSTKEWVIFSIAMLMTFTLGIVLGYFLCKKETFKKLFKKKEKPAEIETLSDTIDLGETIKKVKKKKKE